MKYYLIVSLMFLPFFSFAKQFEIFDGQMYNGLFYPLVDIIEWGEQNGEFPHMEFHIHSDKQIELSAIPGEKNGKPVLWLMYDLRFRGERICRHVIAPAHFKEGMKVYSYKDSTDPDYMNIYVSSEPRREKNLVPYSMPNYEPCSDEMASNKPEPGTSSSRGTASSNTPPVIFTPRIAPDSNTGSSEGKKEGKGIGVDYDNSAVPFSF